MSDCFIQFKSKDAGSLERTIIAFNIIKAEKSADSPSEKAIEDLFSGSERSYFRDLTPEEMKEWNEEWFSTPIEIRHSARMPTPGWDFASMLDAFWNGEYQLNEIEADNEMHRLTFTPFSYPYGGTACMVALIESFGHDVVGVDDGTGYVKYVPRAIWQPKNGPK